jgi:hypothetical protein
MTKTALGLLAWTILTSGALYAQNYSGNRIGNQDYWSGPNGWYGSGQWIGNQYYWTDKNGYGYGGAIGNYHYFNYQPYFRLDDDGD